MPDKIGRLTEGGNILENDSWIVYYQMDFCFCMAVDYWLQLDGTRRHNDLFAVSKQ